MFVSKSTTLSNSSFTSRLEKAAMESKGRYIVKTNRGDLQLVKLSTLGIILASMLAPFGLKENFINWSTNAKLIKNPQKEENSFFKALEKTETASEAIFSQDGFATTQKIKIETGIIKSVEPFQKKEPQKKYTHVERVREKGIVCRYTPFEQGALICKRDLTWNGSCNILSHSWIYRKIRAEDFQAPTSYEITDSHLPHPMLVGDNVEDIGDIHNKFHENFYSHERLEQKDVEKQVGQQGIDALIAFMGHRDSHSMVILSMNQFQNPLSTGYWDRNIQCGHACGFVKKDDKCSWYDSNYGEVTFERFEDFATWFKLEVMEGSQAYILKEAMKAKKEQRVGEELFNSDLFPSPEFSEADREISLLSKEFVEMRSKKCKLLYEYTEEYKLRVFTPAANSPALPEIADCPFM